MGWFNFGKKKASRDIALKRMQNLVGNRREKVTSVVSNESRGNVAVMERNTVNINVNEMSKMIRDYVHKKAKIDKKNVKIHISKDENGYTIVTNIFFK